MDVRADHVAERHLSVSRRRSLHADDDLGRRGAVRDDREADQDLRDAQREREGRCAADEPLGTEVQEEPSREE
jgi:hypothetical protein